MADNFDRAMDLVLASEGGYVNDPRDPGGETKWGISKRSYPTVDIKNLTREDAKALYRHDYWQPLRCDELPWAVALVLVDCGINQGVGTAARMLQRALGVKEDGKIGPVTMAEVKRRDPLALAQEIQARRLVAYASLAGWPVYGLGWTRRAMTTLVEAAS